MKQAVIKFRDTLGAYLNWPLQSERKLGDIGYYHGKEAAFEWRTSLSDLGILIDAAGSQLRMDEMISDRANFEFDPGVDLPTCDAKFQFNCSYAYASQGLETSVSELPIDKLQKLIIQAIDGGLEWDRDWVIVTRLWAAESYSLMISKTKKAEARVVAQTKKALPSFNIADHGLKVGLSMGKDLAYSGIAERKVYPFFDVHKMHFTRDERKPLHLHPYGNHTRSFL